MAVQALAAVLVCAPAAANAAACLVHRTHSLGGESVTSPYGVDRTGRASSGWHQGIDIVNSAGKGDPILSGSAGTANFSYQPRGAGEYVTVNSGDMKYIYMHLQNTDRTLAGKAVEAGQQIGNMGCSGMSQCAPHLHLGAMIRGDVLEQSGAGGRVWREGSGKSTSNSPLTADAIKEALPTAWYLVNPEPFLDHRIPMDGSSGREQTYGPQMGGWRSLTLPRTCSPDQTVIENPRLASTTGTGAASSALDGQAVQRSGNEGFAANQAGETPHGVLIEYARLAAAELAGENTLATMRNAAQMDSAIAHIVIQLSERASHVR